MPWPIKPKRKAYHVCIPNIPILPPLLALITSKQHAKETWQRWRLPAQRMSMLHLLVLGNRFGWWWCSQEGLGLVVVHGWSCWRWRSCTGECLMLWSSGTREEKVLELEKMLLDCLLDIAGAGGRVVARVWC